MDRLTAPSAQSITSSQSPTTPTITTTRPTDDAIEALIHHATTSRPHLENRPLRDTRTQLFVGNLPYRVRWQDLKDLFRKAGTVLRADVSLGPDNRSRGYGTVLLATAEDAGRAVDMFNGYTWQTRVLEVRLDRLMPEYEQGASATPVGLNAYGTGPSTGVNSALSGVGTFTGGTSSLGTTSPAGLSSAGGASLSSAGVAAAVLNRLSTLSSPSLSSSSLSLPGSSAGSASGSGSSPYTSFAAPSTFSRPSSSLAGRLPDLEFGSLVSPSPAASSSSGFQDPSTANRTLFVGNLPFHIQWQDLKDLFRQAGTILRADVALGPDNRSRGFGTVVFANDTDTERAVRMFNGYEFSGRVLKVHHDKFAGASTASNPPSASISPYPPSSSNAASPRLSEAQIHALSSLGYPSSGPQHLNLQHSYTASSHPTRASFQRAATTSLAQAGSTANPHSARLQSQLGTASFTAASGLGSSSSIGGKPGHLQLPPGYVYDLGPPSGPGSPYDIFGQLHQAQMQQHQEQEYFDSLRSQQLRIQHQQHLDKQLREQEEELDRERERLHNEREAQRSRLLSPSSVLDIDSLTNSLNSANLQALSQTRSPPSHSPYASPSVSKANSSESSKPSSTKPVSLPLSLSNSGPGSSSSSGPASASDIPTSTLPRAPLVTAPRAGSFNQHQQQHARHLFQQQVQHPSPKSATTSSGSVTTRTSSTSLSEREVESTAPSSHPSPYMSHERLYGSGFRDREGSMSSECGSGNGSVGRWGGHSRGESRAESISGRSSVVCEDDEGEGESRGPIHEQQQKVSYHPGPISLPPMNFPTQMPMMYSGMPMSPHTPQAHAMAAAAAHSQAQAAAAAAGNHQQAQHHAAHAHAAHQHAMAMGMSISPLHHPAVAAALGQPLGSPYGMYPSSPGSAPPGMIPLTPHGLPPITPSMPPFSFLPPHIQMMQHQHMSSVGYGSQGAPAPSSIPAGVQDKHEARRRGSSSADSDSKASGSDEDHRSSGPQQASSTSSARSSGSSSTASAGSDQKAKPQRQPLATQQPPPSTQAMRLNLGQVHGAFSPGVAMSPGTFYGRPGDVPGPNPFINAAVGAPVHVPQQPIHPMHSPHYAPGIPPPHASHGAYFYAMSSPRNGPTTGMEPQGYFDPMYFPATSAIGHVGGAGGSSLAYDAIEDTKDDPLAMQATSPEDGLSPPEGTTDTSATSSSSDFASLRSDSNTDLDGQDDDGKPELPSRTHSVGHGQKAVTSMHQPARTLSNPQNMARSESEPVTASMKRPGTQ